jgi:hypothetical protein
VFEDFHDTRRCDEDVGRLDVPVHDPGLMRVVERVTDLRAPTCRIRQSDSPSVQHHVQSLAAHHLHDQERDTVIAHAGLAEIVDGHDVGMLQLGSDPSLAQESGAFLIAAAPAAGELNDQLNGDRAPQRLVLGLPHLPHPALSDLPHLSVTTR